MKERMQRRIALGWLLLGLILAPAFAILFWLLVVKAPPGNAVLIEDHVPRSALAVPVIEPTSIATSVALLISAQTSQPDLLPTSGKSATLGAVQSPTIETITVYVSGAVSKPGVYALPTGSRIGDAVTLAGGTLPDADLNQINLAARLADEDHIIVPAKGATPIAATSTPLHPAARATPVPSSRATANRISQKVNLNTATELDLESLPGVGPAIARRIIDYRATYGNFKTVEELMQVPGIKEAVYAKLSNLITVGP